MSQRRQPTAERQRQLAEAALRLLATQGVAGLTAKNLGSAVGISDGAVFKHYPNKEAILDAAITRFEALLDDPVIAPDTRPLERLERFFLHRVERVRENPEILGLAFSHRLESAAGERGRERVRHVMARSVAFIRRCLREGQRAAEVGGSASPEVQAWMVLGVLRAAATGATGRTTPERIWSEVAATLRS